VSTAWAIFFRDFVPALKKPEKYLCFPPRQSVDFPQYTFRKPFNLAAKSGHFA